MKKLFFYFTKELLYQLNYTRKNITPNVGEIIVYHKNIRKIYGKVLSVEENKITVLGMDITYPLAHLHKPNFFIESIATTSRYSYINKESSYEDHEASDWLEAYYQMDEEFFLIRIGGIVPVFVSYKEEIDALVNSQKIVCKI